MNFIFGLTTAALLLLLEHWFPFVRKCHRLVNYVMGSTAILIGIAVWLGIEGKWIFILKIAAFYLVGGLAVAAAHLYDKCVNMHQRLRVMDGRDE